MTEPAFKLRRGAPAEVFLAFLKLGCLSFGGPIAHLGYFRTEFVERRGWLTDESFAEIVALAQSMPGPASSQVGFAVGLLRAGVPGALAAWIGFTLPSALIMLAFAFGHNIFSGRLGEAALHGLQLVAVAVVAQAVATMQRTLAPDRLRLTFAILAVAIVLFSPASLGTVLAIALGAIAGIVLLPRDEVPTEHAFHPGVSRTAGALAGAAFALLLVASFAIHNNRIAAPALFAAFYRVGALVFGGGHVVLPLLNEATVAKGWISQQAFLSGYGAAQALPGPLFSFAAYLGAGVRPNPHPLLYGLCALGSLSLPGLLIMSAVLPFWSALRRGRIVQAALKGINASVVGVLIAALFRPLWTSTVHTPADFWIALAAFALLAVWKLQPWIVVLGVAAASCLVAVAR
jgi:chromate transporter